jgi:hypothetical protein
MGCQVNLISASGMYSFSLHVRQIDSQRLNDERAEDYWINSTPHAQQNIGKLR